MTLGGGGGREEKDGEEEEGREAGKGHCRYSHV